MAEQPLSAKILGPWEWNKLSIVSLKVLLGAFLVWFLVNNDIIELETLTRLYDHYGYAFLSATIFLISIAVAAYRWHLLLAAQNIHLPLTTAIRIVGASYAASIVLAGVIGGEGLRAAWILATMRAQRTVALLSLPLDRLCGLLALLAIGAMVVVLRWDMLMSKSATIMLATLTVSVFTAVIVVIPFGFWYLSRSPLFERIAHWENGGRGKRTIWQIVRAIMVYHDRRVCLIGCFLLSIITNVLTIAAFLVLLEFVPASALGTLYIIFAFVLSSLANVFSITPGGIGIGVGAFEVLCRILGAASGNAGYGTIFFIFRIVTWVPLVAILSVIFLGRWRTRVEAPSA